MSKARKGKSVKFSDVEKYRDGEEQTEVLEVRRMKDARIAKELKLSPDEPFYLIKRLRLVDGKPIIVQHTYVISDFIKEEDVEHKEAFTSIYRKIRADYGIDLYQADYDEITRDRVPHSEAGAGAAGIAGRGAQRIYKEIYVSF